MGKITNIDALRDVVDIAGFIGSFVTLKKSGSAYSGCCPFHNENTPSFTVTPSRGIFKCFGCGEGGDVFKFVMKLKNVSFPEAVRMVAEHQNFMLDEEAAAIEPKEEREKRQEMLQINEWAAKQYQSLLPSSPASEYLTEKRKLTPETILQWRLGYAPDQWRTLTDTISENGRLMVAVELGLCKTKDGRNYDAFRNRVIIPVLNTSGEVVGFGGRDLKDDKSQAKYINSSDSEVFHKGSLLFGLYFAQDAIRRQRLAVLVEGHLDVISLHQAGIINTVATCGTALTDGQCKKLKRYTDRVLVIRDGDAAGRKAMSRDLRLLLQNGMRVECLPMPQGKDPDDLARELSEEDLKAFIEDNRRDAITYECDQLAAGASRSPDDMADAIGQIGELLSLISDEARRDIYAETIAKQLKLKKNLLNGKIQERVDSREKVQVVKEGEQALPGWIADKDEFFATGFAARVDGEHTGYYFSSTGNKLTRLTNFVVKPLFHVYSKQDNKRLIEVTNGRHTKILDMPSRTMVSLDQFRGTLFEEGHYVTDGGFTSHHLLKLIGVIGDQFPTCYELKTLGWQPEGFWAYSNYAFNGELKQFDDMGIVDIHGDKFLSMSVSKANAGIRAEEDIYENDRYLSYRKPPILFSEWCELMVRVYDQNAWMGIAFAVMTAYRDIVFSVTKVPHLYAYGAVQAGKSEFGDSISNLFFNMMPAFNLNQGTDFAFFSRMERFRNCPNALNEFDENAIKEEWFRAIKAAYDGEGREKGRGGKEGKTKTQKINCTLVLMGQYLSTKDDSSVLSRCIPLAFRPKDNRTEEQIADFRRLKELEHKGLSGVLVELFKLRDIVKDGYSETFNKIQRRLLDDFAAEKKVVKSRILKNMAAPMAVIQLLADRLMFPFSKEDFYAYGKKMIDDISHLISESNVLSEFWRTVEFLHDRGEVSEGCEFRIEHLDKVPVYQERGETVQKELGEVRRVIFVRLNTLHTLFADLFKRKHGKSAPNQETVRMYMQDQPYWIGAVRSWKFKLKEGGTTVSSAIALDYDKLGVNLEKLLQELDDTRKELTVTGKILRNAERIAGHYKFTLYTIEAIAGGSFPKSEPRYYTCYTTNIDYAGGLIEGADVTVSGFMSEKIRDDKRLLKIDVTGIVFTNSVALDSLGGSVGMELEF